MNLFEELIGADLGKELKRVVNTVGAGVFLKVLIESTNWTNKNNGVCVVEIRHPRMALSPGATNIKEMPRHSLAVNVNVENMLSDTHRLDACMENIISGWYIIPCRDT
jgi:hypothetical protein